MIAIFMSVDCRIHIVTPLISGAVFFICLVTFLHSLKPLGHKLCLLYLQIEGISNRTRLLPRIKNIINLSINQKTARMTGSRGNKDFAGFKNHEETWNVIYSVEEYFLIWVALAYNYQDISVDLMIKLS